MIEFKNFKDALWFVLVICVVFVYMFVGIVRMSGFNEEKERQEQMCQIIDVRLIESGLVNCNEEMAKAINK